MSHELDINGSELLEMAEEAPDQVEAIIAMMIDADEEMVFDDEAE